MTTPSYTATISLAPTQSVCQNGAVADITVNLTAAVGGSTINSFIYYIDANNNNNPDPGETTGTIIVGAVAPTTATISLVPFTTSGVQTVRVSSVNGTTGIVTLNQGQTTNNSQAITINALPVLGNFSF